MKKILSLAVLALAGFTTASAQDTYSNDLMTNTSDINGTARYVGMGGATGALGGDISGISNNPAGIAAFNRSWASIGMGATIQAAQPADEDARAHYSFDQIGFVVVLPKSEDDRLNFAVNLQKKLHFNRSLIANNYGVGGLSQAAQLAGLMFDFYDSYTEQKYNLPNVAYSSGLYDIYDGAGGQLQFRTDNSSYLRSTSGNLYGLDFNVSGAVDNRFFWGATFGVDFLRYTATTSYLEERTGFYNDQPIAAYDIQDYWLDTYRKVTGTGFNFKAGAIICPIEENPFRFGIAIETPTWYSLKQKDVDMTFNSTWNNYGWDEASSTYAYNDYKQGPIGNGYYNYTNRPDDGYLEFNVRTPWKFRVSLADVHAGIVAWDVEYEYSMNNYTTMGYPTRESNRWEDQSISTDQDRAMNKMTKNITQGVHNVRVGLEVLPTEHLALRAGYNFYSKPFKNNARFDQTIDYSYAMYKVTGTDYMNLGATNIFTFGLGYHIKGFYANLAYKYRMQKGDFYAFDSSYQNTTNHEAQFITEANTLRPVTCNLDRHDITLTLGYEF